MVVGVVIAILGFLSCSTERGIEPGIVGTEIKEYINRTCAPNGQCVVQPAEITRFSWDRLVVFDITVEPDTIREVIGEDFSPPTRFYSKKWFFMQGTKVVHFEERPLPKIDEVMKKGDVDFDLSRSPRSYASFDRSAKFDVKLIQGIGGEAYLLSCANCQ